MILVNSTKNKPCPASFSFIFGDYKQTILFWKKNTYTYEKNALLVSNVKIRTHDLLIMSLIP